ncbi:hypothetical protein BMW24_008800 [Mycobacterium heckeshornense]|uniref:Uncharacterized protein n=1 Tax=Mycobacterium heckeshornense TaxID=110505 RepID=A0A2G8BC18_9MYCO|nr:hypothetical protein BMW24_008800 [Mycobacterium heckeshornense]BCO38058.1 hypothetical protein MHEC_44910 [Mycobacterium heckeshornense]
MRMIEHDDDVARTSASNDPWAKIVTLHMNDVCIRTSSDVEVNYFDHKANEGVRIEVTVTCTT